MSGSTVKTATRAIATSGTLIQKTAPQEKCASSSPPSVGPTTMPTPAMADQAPLAPARSRAGKTAVRIDSVAGITKAPPTPISARAAIRKVASVDRVVDDHDQQREAEHGEDGPPARVPLVIADDVHG
jgi:hypothetical protein